MNTILKSAILVTLLMAASCSQKGQMEKAGERGDEIIDNVKQGKPILHQAGPMEKAGEAVDKVVNGEKSD